MDEPKRVELKVVGERTIHCSGCESTVKFTLSQNPGLKEIEADHQTQVIQFEFDPEITDLETVKADLEWIGYEVEVA
ncbi:MAG: heavy-metal-associated domain-containing protein [Nitrospirae bacterium]|nr:heavy-metal-associated domain-containing protein [Nitrospirota bacterium]